MGGKKRVSIKSGKCALLPKKINPQTIQSSRSQFMNASFDV